MDHVNDEILVRMAAGEIAEEDAAAVRRHIATCEPCARRMRAQTELWALLGEWRVEPAPRDLRDDVLARLDAAGPLRRPRASRWMTGWSVGRAAAGVVFAVGLGYAAGRWTLERARPPVVPVAASEKQAAEALGLPVLAASPLGLDAWLADPLGVIGVEEEPS